MKSTKKRFLFFNQLVFIFMIAALIGWLVEVIGTYYTIDEFVNRGFLYGPFLPIYGFGAMLFALMFGRKKHGVFFTFFVGMTVATVLEYFASWGLEMIFNRTWWDYSSCDIHLNGRIALWSSLLFGLGAVVVAKLIFPLIKKLFDKASYKVLCAINGTFLVYFVVDYLISSTVHIANK